MALAIKTHLPALTARAPAPCLHSARCVARPFTAASPVSSTSGCSVQQQQQQQQRQQVVASAKKGGGKGGAAAETKGKDSKDASSAADIIKVEKEALKDAEDRMKKCLTVVADNFNTIRTGRANPAILDRITVDYFGAPTPIKQMGSVTVPEATVLMITPFDRASLKDIERALLESDIGINPNNDGERIRLQLPQLTQDRRKELVKTASKYAEEGKVAVRNVRKDVMKKVDKFELPKDNKKSLEDGIQKLTDAYGKKIDEALKVKSDELMKV